MASSSDQIIIAPSILACDFAYLAEEVQKIEISGADRIHLDIMDGHFVPNISIGPAVVSACNRSTNLFLDVHLMIYNPFEYIEPFIEAGADLITFHVEATEDIEETISYIKKCNRQVGLAISPDTSVSLLIPFLAYIDQILIMTVHPGFGGQAFLEESLERIEEVRILIDQYYKVRTNPKHTISLQVDGGINLHNAIRTRKAGANSFVSGTYLFKSPDMKSAISEMRSCLMKV